MPKSRSISPVKSRIRKRKRASETLAEAQERGAITIAHGRSAREEHRRAMYLREFPDEVLD